VGFPSLKSGQASLLGAAEPVDFAVLIRIPQSECTPTMKRCYEWLNKTSRSVAAVIQALHPELRFVHADGCSHAGAWLF
jgi:hypothetical protein